MNRGLRNVVSYLLYRCQAWYSDLLFPQPKHLFTHNGMSQFFAGKETARRNTYHPYEQAVYRCDLIRAGKRPRGLSILLGSIPTFPADTSFLPEYSSCSQFQSLSREALVLRAFHPKMLSEFLQAVLAGRDETAW